MAHRLAASATDRVSIRVVTLKSRSASGFDREQPFPVVRSGSPRLPQQARIAVLNARMLWEGVRTRPDAILSLHIVTSPAARLLGRVLGIPVIQYLHADEMRTRPGLTRRAVAAEA